MDVVYPRLCKLETMLWFLLKHVSVKWLNKVVKRIFHLSKTGFHCWYWCKVPTFPLTQESVNRWWTKCFLVIWPARLKECVKDNHRNMFTFSAPNQQHKHKRIQSFYNINLKQFQITQLMKTNFGRLVFGSMTFTYAYKILPPLNSSVSSSIPPSAAHSILHA